MVSVAARQVDATRKRGLVALANLGVSSELLSQPASSKCQLLVYFTVGLLSCVVAMKHREEVFHLGACCLHPGKPDDFWRFLQACVSDTPRPQAHRLQAQVKSTQLAAGSYSLISVRTLQFRVAEPIKSTKYYRRIVLFVAACQGFS